MARRRRKASRRPALRKRGLGALGQGVQNLVVPKRLVVIAAEEMAAAQDKINAGRCLSASRHLVRAVYYFGRSSARDKTTLDEVTSKLNDLTYRVGQCYGQDPDAKTK